MVRASTDESVCIVPPQYRYSSSVRLFSIDSIFERQPVLQTGDISDFRDMNPNSFFPDLQTPLITTAPSFYFLPHNVIRGVTLDIPVSFAAQMHDRDPFLGNSSPELVESGVSDYMHNLEKGCAYGLGNRPDFLEQWRSDWRYLLGTLRK
jgi:hypothetical protein